jgi:hypothetical protein
LRISLLRWGNTCAGVVGAIIFAGIFGSSSSAHAQGASGTGALVIVTTPAGAELRVDGNPAGKSPGSVNNLLPGDHLVEATWPDGKSANAIGRVNAGQSTLVNSNPSAGAAATPGQPAPGQAAPGQPAPGQPPPAPGDQGPAPLNQPIPEQTPDATGNAATPGAVAVSTEEPIRNPFHPQRRHLTGLSFGPGILCGTADCTFRARIALDGFIGDFHMTILGGGFLTAGIGFGGEIGSPYFQLGGLSSPAALAIRANFDVLAVFSPGTPTFDPITGLPTGSTTSGVGGLFVNTFGPNFSIALAHRIALEARLGLGYGVFFPTVSVPFLLDSWIGVRIQP